MRQLHVVDAGEQANVFAGLRRLHQAIAEQFGGQLWKGQSSNEIWSGPAPASAEAWANWMWQLVGVQFPAGVCFKPSTTPPEPGKECTRPILQIELTGTSSAGPWTWESDLFQCMDLSG